MTQGQIASALERYADAKNRHDVEAILSLCAEDAFYESVPMGARITGRDALRDFYSAFFAALPDYSGEFDGVAYGENSAVVWGRFGGTLSGEFMGVPVEAGRRIAIPVTFVCTFRDGLLAGDLGYFDAATLAEQVGVSLEQVRNPQDPASAAAERLIANFGRLWQTKDPEVVREMVAPDAEAHWSGVGSFRGTDYPERMRVTMQELVPDIGLRVTASAVRGDTVFVSWRAQATFAGRELEWTGIDRFRLQGELAVEVDAIWDTGPMREAADGILTSVDDAG